MTCSRHTRNDRRPSGQALAEGTAALVLLTAIGVGMLLLILNTTIMGSYYEKLHIIANESAKYMVTDQYWLGMERRDYDPAKSAANARAVADGMLNAVGLGKTLAGEAGFKVTPGTVTVGAGAEARTYNISRVDIGVGGLMLAGGMFPTGITLRASGIASNASESKANLVGSIYFYNPGNPADSAAFYMPLYGIVKNNEVNGQNSEANDNMQLTGIPRMGNFPNSNGSGTVNVVLSGYAPHDSYTPPGGSEQPLASVGNTPGCCMYNK